MINDGGHVFGEIENIIQVQGQDGFHPIEREPFTEFICDDEKNWFGVRQFLKIFVEKELVRDWTKERDE